MAFVAEVDSRFTGMIFLLRKVLDPDSRGRKRGPRGPDMAYAVRRPRRGSPP